jgi:3-phosphoshikimate 1-carboxyvinyltransferase
MLGHFGVNLVKEGDRIAINGGSQLTAQDVDVPGDISSAAFFLIAAALLPGSDLTMRSVGINGSRAAIVDLLEKCGVEVELINERDLGSEPVADVTVRFAELGRDPILIDGQLAALLIDEAPILSVLGTQLPGGLEFRDAADLRNKECDRIDAICRNLESMGADVVEFEDGFRIGRSRLAGSSVRSYGDHRIAMAFAVAALIADGPTEIEDAQCVDISYPGFFETLHSVVM